MTSNYKLFITCPLNCEDLLLSEIETFGGVECSIAPSGVSCQGNLRTVYRICLESRVAGRVFLELMDFKIEDPNDIYTRIKNYNWDQVFSIDSTFATSAVVSKSKVKNSQFASLRVKDAIADFFRDKYGRRPDVKSKNPDIKIHLHLNKNNARISLDLSGESLHKRGYRLGNAKAALKENVAASVLLRSNWHKMANEGMNFLDPMCGSGTLLIEAAMMATNTPCGYYRFYYGFYGWLDHDVDLWDEVFDSAESKIVEYQGSIRGHDIDGDVIAQAIENIKEAKFSKIIHVEKKDFREFLPVESMTYKKGLICINPPYGIRLGDTDELKGLYKAIGEHFLEVLPEWRLSIITGNEELSRTVPLKIDKKNSIYNGDIKCVITQFSLLSTSVKKKAPLSPGGEAFKNRLIKRKKHLGKWARRQDITCYRVYDADMPDYNVAIDYYEGEFVTVSEYQAPREIEDHIVKKRINEVLEVIPGVLEVKPENVFLKVRKRQKGRNQYSKNENSKEFKIINESGAKFYANFKDYLDTGIFLDHRPIRKRIKNEAVGKKVLNLFSYTGTVTTLAALGGADSTVTVDASQNYLDWAKRNLQLNGLSSKNHQFFTADCREWLKDNKSMFDIIFIDPPTFSNSKSKRDIFNVQDDYVELINLATDSLDKNGVLYFSNNYRKFKFDNTIFPKLIIKDISLSTIDEDFKSNQKIHKCWEIRWT